MAPLNGVLYMTIYAAIKFVIAVVRESPTGDDPVP
jgi:hypothetical protein